MKETILLSICLLMGIMLNAQVFENTQPANNESFNPATNTFETAAKTSNNPEPITRTLTNFEADCSADFWTINANGVIQQWSLIDGAVTGGDIILSDAGSGLAYCGDAFAPTFYSSNFPDSGIIYYDTLIGWVDIPTDVPLLNNGGHKSDQYYMGYSTPNLNELIHFDGTNFTTVDFLTQGSFAISDIAVDTSGRAWVFLGDDILTATSLNVYDKTGLISTYSLSFDGFGRYGSFFLNDTMYVGVGESNSLYPNSIVPVLVNGSSAQLGDPIPFQNMNFYDMASCQSVQSVTTDVESPDEVVKIDVFPNPTTGIIHLKTEKNIETLEVFNPAGQIIHKVNSKNSIDISDQPKGAYLLKVIIDGVLHNRFIIKH